MAQEGAESQHQPLSQSVISDRQAGMDFYESQGEQLPTTRSLLSANRCVDLVHYPSP
jgi:hypothetical protein